MSATTDAEQQLAAAVAMVRNVDRSDLPDDIADDVKDATIALLKAKGHCEVSR